jgi:hypothetical protein
VRHTVRGTDRPTEEDFMKTFALSILSAAILAAASVAANAITNASDPYENFSSSWARATPGSYPAVASGSAVLPRSATNGAAHMSAARTITVNANQSVVSVDHMTAVKFVDARGRSFVWQSNGPGSFPLKTIAPADFDSGKVWIAVVHPNDHMTR